MKTPIRKFHAALTLLCLAWLQIWGWGREAGASQSSASNSPPAAAQSGGGVRSITLPHFEPDLPVAPGRREFITVCVSCHSPRYVTMQPPFPRHQWEETVAKMIKSFGAPADEKQASAIVDYLVAIDGNATPANTGASADEDELAAVSGGHSPPDSEPVPALTVAGNAGEQFAGVKRGAMLFMQDCAGCHGAEGRGDGAAGQVLLLKPANLAATRFNVELLAQVLWNGRSGTSMPSWRSVPFADLNALAAYVQTLHAPTKPETPAPEALARGKTLFAQDCAICHGPLGDGKTAIAATLAPAPANLKWMQPDSGLVLQVLQDGIPGTSMPSWKEQISEPDREALAGFVRSLYEPAKADER